MKNNLLQEILTMAKPIFYVIFLQVLFASFLFAEESSAQKKSVYEIEISIQKKDVSVIEVFEEIESKTDFLFTYNDKFIGTNEVSVNKRSKSVGQVLEYLSKTTDLQFKRINDNIHVYLREGDNVAVYEDYGDDAEITVSGTVIDSDGEVLPGVTVLVKGTTTGTVSDIDGSYSIPVDEDGTLVFSSVGFIGQEVQVNGRSVIDITMEYDVQSLAEVVVTGYSSQRKRDITGAVTVIDAESMNEIKAPSFAQKLAGRAPGVTISTSGQPGEGTNIRVRGISAFNGSDPLVIIDGVQVQGDKSLSALNPNDIESMQVLKDASAASIYGSRANSGVIIITTKQGTPGRTKVTYDGYAGVQTPVGGFNDFMVKDPRDYARFHMARNPGVVGFYGGDPNNPVIPEYFYPEGGADPSTYSHPDNIIMRSNPEGTDWWDVIFEPALITEHNVGLSGGNEHATYSASVGYLKQDGTMKHTGFDRFSARINSRMNAGKFTFGESISVAHSKTIIQQGGNGNEQNTVTQTMLMNSIVPVYDIAGNYGGAKTTGFSNAKNPLAFTELNQHDVDTEFRILGNLFGEYNVFDFLKFRTSFSTDFRQRFLPRANFPRFEDREVNSNNSYGETHQTFINWMWTNTLEFNQTFGLHTVKVLAGYEAVQNNFRQINAQVNNLAFIDPNVRFLDLSYSTFSSLGSQERVVALASMFGKVDYEFNDRYLISGTVRRDGTSEFLGDNRFGVFPAVSVGWRISSESFMENATLFDDLKLRAGWGITGNQNIPIAYNAYNQYGGRSPSDAGYPISGGNQMAGGFTLYRYGNPDTRWEENISKNIGLDAALLDGKLNLVFDVYTRDIDGLLFNAPLPGAAGNSAPQFKNLASMRNTGWDLGIGFRDNIGDEVRFNTFLNVSHYKNEITNLDGEQDFVFPEGIDKRFGDVNIWEVGHPISSFYGYINDGFFNDQSEVNALDQPGAQVGTFKRKDLNGDDAITADEDRTVIGNPHPDVTVGWNLGFEYKGFDLSMFLFASIGNDIYNYNKVFSHLGQFSSNISEDVLTQSWTEGGDNSSATLPRWDLSDTNASQSSDFYVEDGSYLRAQNITLGYDVPTNNILGLDRLRVYVQGQNLFTITGYSGVDPDLSNVNIGVTVDGQQQNDGWKGYDLGNYPTSKIFMIGVNAAF